MAQVATCERCGGDIAPGDNFCGSCGAPVPAAPEEPAHDPYVTFIGTPVADQSAEDDDPDGADAPPEPERAPLPPTVIGIRAIRLDEVTAPEPRPERESDPAPPAPEERPPVAPTVIGMPAISMPSAAEPFAADEPDVDPELEAEIEAMRAAARAKEAEEQRQAEAADAAEAQRQAAAEAEARAEAQRLAEAHAEAERQAEEQRLRDEAAAQAEAERQAELVAERRAEAERQGPALAEPTIDDDPEPTLDDAEPTIDDDAGADVAVADSTAPFDAIPEPLTLPVADEQPAAVERAPATIDDEALGESLPAYAAFGAHVARLEELVHLAAHDPAGRTGDTLRRSVFVLLWTAFDAFARDTLTTLAERRPAALLAAADEGDAVSLRELLAMSDGLESLDALRAGLATRELERMRARMGSVRGTIEAVTTTFGGPEPALPLDYEAGDEPRTLDANALEALEQRRDGLVHGDGGPVASDELADAQAALTTLARTIAQRVV